MNTRIFYTVRTMTLKRFPGRDAYKSEIGTSPGGRTIEEAHIRVRKEIERIGIHHLNDVTFDIVKTVETEEIVEEIVGKEASFFMLKG